MSDIQSRKADHLDLAVNADVGFRDKTTLFECVQLVHEALPELSLDQVDTRCEVFGRPLKAPLLIAGMTGGTERAGEINRVLAKVAAERGYAFGLGSQRPMLTRPETIASYRVRDAAPDVVLLGNVGAVQAAALGVGPIRELVSAVGADALCVHLNPAMELVQPEGDRSFVGCMEVLRQLRAELSVPVVAKETGCGISAQTAQRLRTVGIEHVDVSGAGGTSWVAVETLRTAPESRRLGEVYWDWGIPTAATVMAVAAHSFRTVFATGGMSNGLEAAKALCLGANIVGIARPVLQAYERGGEGQVREFLLGVERELRTAMVLVGAANLKQLRSVPRFIDGRLQQWAQLWHASGYPGTGQR
jgi:isopentenyl-diphosphate Delta-isomerase